MNINRAVEGLRVIEEIVRFVLEDKELTGQLKVIRRKLRQILENVPFHQRMALKDVGRKLYTSGEARRETVQDVFSANAKRVQEAVRVLEEFSKLIRPEFGRGLKDIRFQLYELEKRIALRIARCQLLDFDLYLVTDPMRDHVAAARKAIAGGIRAIQLRDETASKHQLLKWARQMRKLTAKAKVTFIVNDHVDIAKAAKADGVHLGQADLKKVSIRRARKELGEDKIIGISVSDLRQALQAQKAGADYVSVWPVFSTPIKPGISPVGLRMLRKVIARVRIPVVAIGGINERNIDNVLRTGCARAAVIRAVLGKRDMRKAVRILRKRIFRRTWGS